MARSRPPAIAELGPADFSRQVIEIFNARKVGLAPSKVYAHDVRQAAYGLFALWQAADYFHKKMYDWRDPAKLAGSGFPEAIGILEALTTGHDHAIWKHLKGIHTASFRPQNAPPVAIERTRREVVVGLVLALQEVDGLRELSAIREVTSKVISTDFHFSVSQVRGWMRREDGAAFCQKIIREAASLVHDERFLAANPADRVLKVGGTLIFELWSVPV